MQKRYFRTGALALAVLGVCALPHTPRADAQSSSVAVVVDGQPMQFNEPPTERAGRVYVPLRGVFERLGATVVYDNGVINATKGRRQISLTIGSTDANVDGSATAIDSPPYVENGATMVPLRFISQALGASVRYDDSSDTVYIAQRAAGGLAGINPGGPMIPAPAPASDEHLVNRQPIGQTGVSDPAVSADFSQPVQPDSVRIRVDDRDVAQSAYVSSDRFLFAAPNIPSGGHTVEVNGVTQSGAPFDRQWSFTSGSDEASNSIERLQPAPDSQVGRNFTISGQTDPNSRVHIAVSENAQALGGIFRVHSGTFDETTTALPNGRFSVDVHLQPLPGGKAQVLIQSVSPSGAATVRRFSLNT